MRLGHIDVAVIDDLTWTARTRAEGLRITELFTTPLVVVFRADHEWSGREEVRWRTSMAGRS